MGREETGTDSSMRQSTLNRDLYQALFPLKQHSVHNELEKTPTRVLQFQGISDKSGQNAYFSAMLNNGLPLQTCICQAGICTHMPKKCLVDFIFQLSWTIYYAA